LTFTFKINYLKLTVKFNLERSRKSGNQKPNHLSEKICRECKLTGTSHPFEHIAKVFIESESTARSFNPSSR
jgi:hypothetical protein